MERERNGKNIVIGVLLATVLCMSVAFAAFTNINLKINGTVNLPDARWDVKFTDATLSAGSIGEKPTFTDNTVTYTVTLTEGSTYEFDAVISNDGTYDAKLKTLTVSDVPTALNGLVTYEVTGVTVNSTIAAGDTATVHVKVTMGTIDTDAKLTAVQGNQSLTLTVLAEYEQA